jgi:hypothetical protein
MRSTSPSYLINACTEEVSKLGAWKSALVLGEGGALEYVRRLQKTGTGKYLI